MPKDVAALIEAGRALDPDQRAIVANELQQMDEPDQAVIDDAWRAEIERRSDELHSGTITPVDGRETLRLARASLAARYL